MSFIALQWAFKQKCRSVTQQMILTALANFANEQGVCWPSKNTLADVCRLSKAAVCSNLNVLRADGLIEVEERGGEPGKSRQTSSLIRLKMEAACLIEGQTGVQQEDRGTVQQEDRYKNQSDMNQSKEPIISPLAALEAEFEEFWAAYPKRKGGNPKHPAWLKYQNARKRLLVSSKHLLTAVQAYAASRSGEDPRFTKMAATWLNQRCWEDAMQPAEVGVPMTEVQRIQAVYPGRGSLEAAAEAIRQQNAVGEIGEILLAAEKYALLLKRWRSDGVIVNPPSLENFIKFKWREMANYEFCYIGMNNKKSVRPIRSNDHEVRA